MLWEAPVSCTLVQGVLRAEVVAQVRLTVVVILLQVGTTAMSERGLIGGVEQMVFCKRGDLMGESYGSDNRLIDHVEDSETALVPLVLVLSFSIQVAEAKACDNIASRL